MLQPGNLSFREHSLFCLFVHVLVEKIFSSVCVFIYFMYFVYSAIVDLGEWSGVGDYLLLLSCWCGTAEPPLA